MKNGQILHFPKSKCFLFTLAEEYVDMYVEQGVVAASQFLAQHQPPVQLKHQLINLIQEEFNARGMSVTVQK